MSSRSVKIGHNDLLVQDEESDRRIQHIEDVISLPFHEQYNLYVLHTIMPSLRVNYVAMCATQSDHRYRFLTIDIVSS
jgi:hypothetical protein